MSSTAELVQAGGDDLPVLDIEQCPLSEENRKILQAWREADEMIERACGIKITRWAPPNLPVRIDPRAFYARLHPDGE